jgi:hypothetical protein
MFKDRAYVCNLCRKVITYSPDEGGRTLPCPFCKTAVTLPAAPVRPGAAPARRKVALLGWAALALLLLLAGAAAGVRALASRPRAGGGARPDRPLVPQALAELVQAAPRATAAPGPARVRGVEATVAVAGVSYGCPEVYQAALGRAARTETPVCSVELLLTNTGKRPLGFRPWRLFEAINDPKKACLTRGGGTPYSLVSFGAGSAPVGAQEASELAPGAALTDVVFFFCDARPACDLELTLPCENLGGRGDLRFLIPAEMIK